MSAKQIRGKYTQEYKLEAVRQVKSGQSIAVTAKVLGIPKANRHQRQVTWSPANTEGRWRAYGYDDLVVRDKISLDIFWLKDDSLANSDNLPAPGVIAQEMVEDLEAALEQFRLIAADLTVQA